MAGRGHTRARRMLAWLVVAVSTAGVTVIALPASAATSTFTPSADALVSEATPSTNAGTSTALRVDGGSDPDVQTYLRFPVSGLSGTVQSATLRLWATSPTNGGPSVFTTAGTWGETTITWANRTALTGQGVGTVPTIATSSWAAFDVTSIVTGDGTYDLVLAGTSTDGVDFQSREAANDPQLVITTQTGGDTTAPSAPTDLTAALNGPDRIDLSWAASTDDIGVSGYEIFRDGGLLATVGAVTGFADTALAPGTSYDYQVRARDAAGNRSGFSNTASATTPPPSTVTFTSVADAFVQEAKPTFNAGSSKTLRVDGGSDPDVESYLRFSVADLPGEVEGATLRLWVASATADGPAVFVTSGGWSESTISWSNRPARTGEGVADQGALASGAWASFDVSRLVTGAGQVDLALAGTSPDGADLHSREGTNDPQLVIRIAPDIDAPTPPADLSATAQGATRVDLSWTGSIDNVAVTNYEISRDGTPIATVGAVTTYADTTASPATAYTYRVRALDASGNASDPSDPATASTPDDTTAPTPPTGLAASPGGTRITLSWSASTDDVGVANYEIFRDDSLLATVGPETTYADTTVASGVTYTYKVRALDAAGNPSGFSDGVTANSADTEAPTAPADLVATPVSATRIDLRWTAATDNVEVTGYAVYRGGSLLTTLGAVTTYADRSVAPGTAYGYQVKAIDAAGNESGFSNTASATTPQQVVTLAPVADARVEQANPSTNFGTAALRVDGGAGVHVESYLSFTASNLSGTVRSATLRVYASSGTADGPAVSPAGTSWTEGGITWANKPGAGSPVADVGGIATGTWIEVSVTSLVDGNGTYAFKLAGSSTDGVDLHSREGANAPQLVITTGAPDTEPPAAPTALTASASSPTRVDLTWTASTDDVAVTNYLIYRGASLIATIGPATTYTDTTVSANTTYTYTVKARDGAGNLSGASNAVTVRTPTAGAAPTIAAAGDIACATTDASYNGGLGTSTACRQLATSNLLVNAGLAAVLPLGDEQYNSGSLSQFQAAYDPTWGRVKSISHPVVGNHEYGTSNASGYFTYFGAAAGDPSKGYYSFDVGSWHLIALNSNCSRVACDAGSPQEVWLQADLAAHPTQCTLAFAHHARWSSGHDGDNTVLQPIWRDLYDANVELFLSGHSHNYERFAPQNASGQLDTTGGVRQFVIGTGGAFFTGVSSAHANSQVRNNDTFGILKLTLRSTSYDWQFVPEAGETFTDSGSTSCH